MTKPYQANETNQIQFYWTLTYNYAIRCIFYLNLKGAAASTSTCGSLIGESTRTGYVAIHMGETLSLATFIVLTAYTFNVKFIMNWSYVQAREESDYNIKCKMFY